jgi:hypothetical protein
LLSFSKVSCNADYNGSLQDKLGSLQDAAAAAAHAKEKLMQRQERLEVQSFSDTLRLVSVVDDSLGDPMPSL